jgi:hypothetical protein
MYNPAAFFPDVNTMDNDPATNDHWHFPGFVYIVGDQNGCAIREFNHESLMARRFVIVLQNPLNRGFAGDFDVYGMGLFGLENLGIVLDGR